ncbi:hypothetical protein [Neolewinella maritima]|nr:hypothetical protein [Neolewinella maritima]
MTIPRDFQRITSLDGWPNVDRSGYADSLIPLTDSSSECGRLYLIDDLKVDEGAESNGLDGYHPSCGNYTFYMAGTNGRPCATPMRGTREAVSQVTTLDTEVSAINSYIVVVWDWTKSYPLNSSNFQKQGVFKFLWKRFKKRTSVCLVGMLIPGNTVVWVPILRKKRAKRAREVLSSITNPVLVLKRPYFVDGPDIFIANCNFKVVQSPPTDQPITRPAQNPGRVFHR